MAESTIQDAPIQTIDTLIEKVKTYLPTVHERRLREAYEFAEKAHAGQTRMSGEPYITHPLAIAFILTDFKADEDSLVVALMHDVVEDTHFSLREIEKYFGQEVSHMIDALTKLPRVNQEANSKLTPYQNKIESIRKVFEVMEDDVRIIVIKLCDRLHNMQSLYHFRPDKQKRIAQETFDIFVKIADRLSIGLLKDQITELSFQYLYPAQYQSYQQIIHRNKPALEHEFNAFIKKLKEDSFFKAIHDIRVTQNIPYSQYHKTLVTHQEVLTEIILILKNEEECYKAVYRIHSLWKPIVGQFRDYITSPKSNRYQGIKTSLVMRDGRKVRVILQTPEMNQYSRYGITLHCFGGSGEGRSLTLPWASNLKRIHRETKEKSQEYYSALETDILAGSITVNLVNGKTLFLPPRSTALDAAFYHFDRDAFRLKEVHVNGKTVHFTSSIHNGDSIAFSVGLADLFMDEWIYQVHSAYARSFISERIRSFSPQKRIQIGRNMIQEELSYFRYEFLDEIAHDKKQEIARQFEYHEWNELLEAVALQEVSVELVVSLLYKDSLAEKKVKQYVMEILREVSDLHSVIDICQFLDSAGLNSCLQETRPRNGSFVDRFLITCSSYDIHALMIKMESKYIVLSIKEFIPHEKSKSILLLSFLVVLWAVNPFLIKYLVSHSLAPINTAAIRMLSAAFVLFLIILYRKISSGEKFEKLHFSILFWLCTLFLTLNVISAHYSLQLISGGDYMTIMVIGYLSGLIALSRYFHPKNNSIGFLKNMLMILVLLFSFAILIWLSLDPSRLNGIGFVVLCAISFYCYTFFNKLYQSKERIQGRSLVQLEFIFLFGGLCLLLFADYQGFSQVSRTSFALAVLNGVFSGALAHYIYFLLTPRVTQSYITFGYGAMLFLVLLIDLFLGTGNYLIMIPFGLILISLGVSLKYLQERESPHNLRTSSTYL